MTVKFFHSTNLSRAGILFLALLLVASALLGNGKTVAQSRSNRLPRTASSVNPKTSLPESKSLRILPIRLHPGQDLRRAIEDVVKARNIRAGFVLTAVGSLQNARIRLADQKDPILFTGKMEIVSLVGTMGQDGVHLHISIADSTGKTIGGHLVEGCLIYTTAEIVIGDAQGLTFSREPDEQTGYSELKIRRPGH